MQFRLCLHSVRTYMLSWSWSLSAHVGRSEDQERGNGYTGVTLVSWVGCLFYNPYVGETSLYGERVLAWGCTVAGSGGAKPGEVLSCVWLGLCTLVPALEPCPLSLHYR
ncbi:hypothetical protein BDW75DRAFT_202014 [Aspergillus navahoensis]